MLHKLMIDGKTPAVDAQGLHIVCAWVDEEVLAWTRNTERLWQYSCKLTWEPVQ
jgi:uncharacterized protein (DUF2237 family)